MIEIASPRLLMRQIKETDWPLFLRLHQEEDVIRYAFDQPELDDIRQRFESRLPVWQWGSAHWLCLVITDSVNQRAVGVTGLCIEDESDDSVEIGYLLLPEYHGKGIGTESLLALIKHIKQFFPTVKNINAIVTDGNVASCKVLEKAGFELMEREENAYQIGGKLYDDLIYRFHI
ncbi:GNAT family N-acetyltransferase [Vibrio neptunius]|uniref:GNAT family N-acetyltransferase n=1 Tax=Vibrio neptunius TaxID=170651 RepID=A0ABS3A7K2_9VIBR|nr:GNAT family N-acetyltransferase [Vibrio neptunius]MBN3495195.1 GNAT family N-acetyltransferase [Vibrio neptunius]MBN3517665.1 GNAT family N-acetyltransferase [Vibrio neptunius]MBN3551984.1 GNAT family N-acetyltransferase [Vibrio neptunius]MBN3572039.1 GNAT family N-acetyltransferase [Vibrio neptunius]MBN3580010.1 GNAT family N-acetyltransferase [Vibrio neptunius]